MVRKKRRARVVARAAKDPAFPEVQNLSYKEMYDVVAKFIKKAVPIRGNKLTIIRGFNNRVAIPDPPYVVLQIIDENQISSTETRYTDKHKILWCRSEITMSISFNGTGNISALQMAKAFVVRFNDIWASEQFAEYSKMFFPLYSDEVRIEKFVVSAEDQYDDSCSVTCYFEYHPQFGVCAESAKEVIMTLQPADVSEDGAK